MSAITKELRAKRNAHNKTKRTENAVKANTCQVCGETRAKGDFVKCPHCGDTSPFGKRARVGVSLIFCGLFVLPAMAVLLFVIAAIAGS